MPEKPSARSEARFIYHIAFLTDWEEARHAGEYLISTRGRTLEEEGFIHASFDREQVEKVGSFVYAESSQPVVVLKIDTAGLESPVRAENLDGGEELFPHVYGPLPVDAIVDVNPARIDGPRFDVEWPGPG